MPSAEVSRIRRRTLPAVVPPLIDAVPKRPPHFLPVPRDEAGHPWPTELDVRTALPPPAPLDALLDALAVIPAGSTQYLRFRGDPRALLDGLAEHAIDAAAEAMPDGSWRLRAIAPAVSVALAQPTARRAA